MNESSSTESIAVSDASSSGSGCERFFEAAALGLRVVCVGFFAAGFVDGFAAGLEAALALGAAVFLGAAFAAFDLGF